MSACGAAGQSSEQAADDGVTRVVASTSVYGDLVEQIAGDAVELTSIVTTTAQDPHSYEATAQDKLALSKADLVVANGGGYDYYMDQLVGDLGLADDQVVTAVDYSEAAHEHAEEEAAESAGHDDDHGDEHDHGDDHAEETADEHAGHHHAEYNEHVWYDLHVMDAVATDIAERLSELEPEQAETFEANRQEFSDRLAELEERQSGLGIDGDYAMTEPVPYYLLEEAGLSNATPEGYSEAIEHGDDVAPLIQRELVELLDGGDVVVLAYNPQTSSPQTEAAREAAEAAGVPVVEFTETLPEQQDYIEWMDANLTALEDALAE
nr:zinc ABC transporter substrate-binding protein [Zhihengliuella flava]